MTLTKLIELQAAATPGPWELKTGGVYSQVESPSEWICCNTTYYPTAVNVEDMQLIVAARNFDFAALDAKIKRLERVEQSYNLMCKANGWDE